MDEYGPIGHKQTTLEKRHATCAWAGNCRQLALKVLTILQSFLSLVEAIQVSNDARTEGKSRRGCHGMSWQ